MTRWTSLFLSSLIAIAFTADSPRSFAQKSVIIQIDAAANRHPINPNVYGVAYASPSALADLNAPLHRYGGNNSSRYNWKLNADNRANDWYFESIADDSAVPGGRGDSFITDSKKAGAEAMLTIPTIGWVAKVGLNRSKLASFSVKKYGPQVGTDAQWYPDAGNGMAQANGKPITGNDPTDASVLADSAFMAGWVDHLIAKWGKASNGGLRYYILDNEPSIWQGTHRDVHPIGPKMEEIRDKILDYGAMIKAKDPSALVVGPEEWGWSGYLWSGYDQQYASQHNWSSFPDKYAHNEMDYLPWLLDQLQKNDKKTGKRVLDVFTVHFYPQGGEGGDDTSSAKQLLRNRSTRSLWDPAYTDASWINAKVELIPRLKKWVAKYYPGTQIGLTEYNWGAENHINGATAQADIYGILGREGLDMATRWTTPKESTPTFKAMKLYRNYDGNKSGFGETSVSATVPNPDVVSAFASIRAADGALTLMVINKQLSSAASITANLAHFDPKGTSQGWQLTTANSIQHLADVAVSAGSLTATVPPQSVTLFVLPPKSTPLKSGDLNGDGKRTILDATLSLQIAVGLVNSTPDQLAACDMNGDGKLNLQDTILLLQAVVSD